MGTRGIITIKYNNKYYQIYNHYDSYGSALGVNLIKEISKAYQNNTYQQWTNLLLQCTIKSESSHTLSESEKEILYKCTGSIEKTLLSKFIYTVESNLSIKPTINLMIEYVYILDLDNDTFSIYSENQIIEKIKIKNLYLLCDFVTTL